MSCNFCMAKQVSALTIIFSEEESRSEIVQPKEIRQRETSSFLLLFSLIAILAKSMTMGFLVWLSRKQTAFVLTSKWWNEIFQSEQSGGRDTHKSRGHHTAQCPPLTHIHTHTHPTRLLSLSDWFVPWVSNLPQLQFLYPAPPLPACLQDAMRTSLCACVYANVWRRTCVFVFVWESYCCIYVVRSSLHLMQYDIFHFVSNPGYFCQLHQISHCTIKRCTAPTPSPKTLPVDLTCCSEFECVCERDPLDTTSSANMALK